MKFNSKFFWFALLAPSVTVAACAAGSEVNGSDPQPTKVTEEPTEPPPESIKVPPKSPPPAEPSDAGDGAAPAHVRPDASACANLTPGSACAIDPQCGCDTGETCDVVDRSTGKVGCVAAGEKVLGATCVTPTQCAQGLTCADSICRPLCSKDSATCTGANLGACREFTDPPGQVVPEAKVCTIACDLQNPSAVCGENNCLWNKTAKASDCYPSGSRKAHEGCSRLSDCAPGLTCVVANQFKVECEPWCRIGHQEDCGGASFCNDVYGQNAPVVGDSKLGHCQ